MTTGIVYALTAIALLVAARAARGVYRALCDDLREDLAYAGRSFSGLRIVLRWGVTGDKPAAPLTAGVATRLEAFPHAGARPAPGTIARATNGHRLRLVQSDAFGDLTYHAYAANRRRRPDIAPDRWGRVFDDVDQLEARFQREKERHV